MENIYSYKGWFEDTVPAFADYCEDISILRLDGDLYNSTYVCLKYLYPKVIKGGLVIIDDWALPGCRSAVDDYFVNGDGNFADLLDIQFITNGDSKVAYWTK